jgi:hypothetical protein
VCLVRLRRAAIRFVKQNAVTLGASLPRRFWAAYGLIHPVPGITKPFRAFHDLRHTAITMSAAVFGTPGVET